jgi:hypothetical protein
MCFLVVHRCVQAHSGEASTVNKPAASFALPYAAEEQSNASGDIENAFLSNYHHMSVIDVFN